MSRPSLDAAPAYEFMIPGLRLVNTANRRPENSFARARRRRMERDSVAKMFASVRYRSPTHPNPPWVITLTRQSPGGRMDEHDGLPNAFKSIVDEICNQLRVDDGDKENVRFVYQQVYAREPSVKVRIEEDRECQ